MQSESTRPAVPKSSSGRKWPSPSPAPARCASRHKAIGLNYIDTYHRTGLYPMPMPSGLGLEAAGVVEAVGPGVTELKAGDRVAYCNGPIGAYAEKKIHPVERLVKIPDGISFEQAACMMLQGLTVQYLFRRTYPLKAGETILFHAAAGGVGLIACQWAKALGVHMIGTVGSEEKAKLAARPRLRARRESTRRRISSPARKEITAGKGVPVVYDGVGKDTFMRSLDCLQPRGLMVSFGNASGAVEPLNLGILSAKGSLYVTRPTLITHTTPRAALVAAADELFGHVLAGRIKIAPRQSYALKDAQQAHRDLEARKTTGSTILVP